MADVNEAGSASGLFEVAEGQGGVGPRDAGSGSGPGRGDDTAGPAAAGRPAHRRSAQDAWCIAYRMVRGADVVNQRHLLHALHALHALHEYETRYSRYRAHQAIEQAAPLRAVPSPITDLQHITDLDMCRHDRIGGIVHEYRHAA